MASAYRYARRKAAIETELGEEAFPTQCLWSFAGAMDEGSGRSRAGSSWRAGWGLARLN